jgi:hypothetical protein
MDEMIDAHGIAARIRGLIGGQDKGDVARTAERLGVSELALRMTLDPAAPQLNTVVLLAVIRNYGVDPMWLLSGEYNLTTHREAMEDDESATTDVLEEMVRRSTTGLPNGSPYIRLVSEA